MFQTVLENKQDCWMPLNWIVLGWMHLESFLDACPLLWSGFLRSVSPRKRGVMVNRSFGEKSQQLHNRHARSDFETQTQVGLESV